MQEVQNVSHIPEKLVPVAVISSLALTTALFGGNSGLVKAAENKAGNALVKNIIFLIGDGMGTSYTTAYRYMKDDPATPVMEPTEFDKYLVGAQMTYAEDEKQNITDSASAATAMSSGVKTYNNAIAVDNDKSEVETVLERAKKSANRLAWWLLRKLRTRPRLRSARTMRAAKTWTRLPTTTTTCALTASIPSTSCWAAA